MQLDPRSAVVVFSGGQDSTTCLGWALARFQNVKAVTFFYGQKHNIEIGASALVVKHFRKRGHLNLKHEIVTLSDTAFAGVSPLTNRGEELETYSSHDEMEQIIGDRVEKTFVPMRNAVLLMLAANRAIEFGAASLVTGVCQADNANYPDCRQEFIGSAEETINLALGLDYDFSVHTPLMHMSKAESIKLALSLHHTYAALAWSHTAYDGKYPPQGRDHASVLRAHGFEQADTPDPLVLRAWAEQKMDLPDTANYRPERIEWARDYLSEIL